MKRSSRHVALLMLIGLLYAASTHTRDEVAVHVSPRFAMEGSDVYVTVRIEPNEDNRVLRIEADSPALFRSSEISLEGDHAPTLHLLTLRSLPPGAYIVRAIVARSDEAVLSTTIDFRIFGLP